MTQKLTKKVLTHTILMSRCIAQTVFFYLLGPSLVDCNIPLNLLAFKTVSFVSSVGNANNLCLQKRISRSIFFQPYKNSFSIYIGNFNIYISPVYNCAYFVSLTNKSACLYSVFLHAVPSVLKPLFLCVK